MEKKSQPVLVIWVGVMLVVIIGIGMAAYFTCPAPTEQMQSQPAASTGTDILDNTYRAAYFTRPAPMDNQLSDETNKITVSIYDGRNGPGQAQFLGSGVIVTSQNILTNAHIVNNKTNLFVYVFAPQAAVYPVVLSRCDSANDLALLKVTNNFMFSSTGLLGNPDEVAVGDSVFAMGNAFGNGNILISGVIIDKNFAHSLNGQTRTSMRTNISISLGTCGGPLVNTRGEIIGINNSFVNPEIVTPINRALAMIYNNPRNQVASTGSAQFV